VIALLVGTCACVFSVVGLLAIFTAQLIKPTFYPPDAFWPSPSLIRGNADAQHQREEFSDVTVRGLRYAARHSDAMLWAPTMLPALAIGQHVVAVVHSTKSSYMISWYGADAAALEPLQHAAPLTVPLFGVKPTTPEWRPGDVESKLSRPLMGVGVSAMSRHSATDNILGYRASQYERSGWDRYAWQVTTRQVPLSQDVKATLVYARDLAELQWTTGATTVWLRMLRFTGRRWMTPDAVTQLGRHVQREIERRGLPQHIGVLELSAEFEGWQTNFSMATSDGVITAGIPCQSSVDSSLAEVASLRRFPR
jgi:hypothetical protein